MIAVWHLPPFYNAAMANHNLHILEHLMFMGAAVLMFWLLAPIGCGIQLLTVRRPPRA